MEHEVEDLIRAEIVARVGYIDRRGLPCVVPITYAYDGRAIFGYGLIGAKIENMGASPNVCVEIDRIENAADWRSVILRGSYERLEGAQATAAIEQIRTRLAANAVATGAPLSAGRTFVDRKGGSGIAYRILISEKRGRRAIPEEYVEA